MYQGKDEERSDNINATMWPIVKLTESEHYHNKHHLLVTDNWYPQLDGVVLCSNEPGCIDYVGTIKANRKGLQKRVFLSPLALTRKSEAAWNVDVS